MLSESGREHIRCAYYQQQKGIRYIAAEFGYSRDAVVRAISDLPSKTYRLSRPHPSSIKELSAYDFPAVDNIPKAQFLELRTHHPRVFDWQGGGSLFLMFAARRSILKL